MSGKFLPQHAQEKDLICIPLDTFVPSFIPLTVPGVDIEDTKKEGLKHH